nr:non-receptor tyrosine-protein kinase TNK1 [Chrysemys picta bellii]
MAPDDGTDWLLALLTEIQLEQFYHKIRDELHVTRLGHFDYVKPADLDHIGMGRPGQRRLEDAIKRRKQQWPRPKSWVYKMIGGPRTQEPGEGPSRPPPPRPDSDTPLKCLISEWDLRLRERLGDGCFGVVHRGEWTPPGGGTLSVAVKSLRSDVSTDPLALVDFLNEVNTMSTLDHPHLLRLHGVVLSQPLKMVSRAQTPGFPRRLREWSAGWCAPESLRSGVFSHASDVWMFGVTLWEMFSYGEEPWMGRSGRQIMLSVEREGARLERPEDCPRGLYGLQRRCWAPNPEERPHFRDIVGLLHEVRDPGGCWSPLPHGRPPALLPTAPLLGAVERTPESNCDSVSLSPFLGLSKSLDSVSDFSVLRAKPRRPGDDLAFLPRHVGHPPSRSPGEMGLRPLETPPKSRPGPRPCLPRRIDAPLQHPGARDRREAGGTRASGGAHRAAEGVMGPPCGGQNSNSDMEWKIKEVEEKVHGVTVEECREALRLHGWDTQRAIETLKVALGRGSCGPHM